MLKVYVVKDMTEEVYKDGKLVGYIERTVDGLMRELPLSSNEFELVFV